MLGPGCWGWGWSIGLRSEASGLLQCANLILYGYILVMLWNMLKARLCKVWHILSWRYVIFYSKCFEEYLLKNIVGAYLNVIGIYYGTLWEVFVGDLGICLLHAWCYIKMKLWHMVWCKDLWSSVYGWYDVLLEALYWLAWNMLLCMVDALIMVGTWLWLVHIIMCWWCFWVVMSSFWLMHIVLMLCI